jgi:protein tyrosine/serine phosphatase
VTATRALHLEGCFNARDLGGLPAAGGAIRRGAVVRSDAPDGVTAAGWRALLAHGVRTVIDLRNDGELGRDRAPRPDALTTVRAPLDDDADRGLWQRLTADELDGSPLYYAPFLEAKPERCAAAIGAIARAAPGGVLVHCVGGRDRTGLVVLLLLALAGVPADAIAVDYELSNARLPARWAALGEPDQRAEIDRILTGRGTSARALDRELVSGLDADAYLRAAGLTDRELAALRDRLLGARRLPAR